MKKGNKVTRKRSSENPESENAYSSSTINFNDYTSSEKDLSLNTFLLNVASKVAKFGGWSVDVSTQVVYWSDEVCDIHEEQKGHLPKVNEGINYYAPEYRDIINKAFSDCETNGIPFDLELQIITAKGNRVWVRSLGEAVKDSEGNIIKVQGAFQDITTLKQYEQGIRESEEKYRALIETSIDSIYIIQNDKIVYINTTGVKTFGAKSQDEIIGKNLLSFFPAESHDNIRQRLNAMFATGKNALRNENKLLTLDGKVIDVEVSAAPIQFKGQTAFQVVLHDISKRKADEKLLKSSEERFRKAFSLHPGIISISRFSDGTYLDVNDNFCKLLEFERSEVIGVNSKKLGFYYDYNNRTEIINILNRDGSVVNFEIKVKTKSGKIKTGLFSAEYIEMNGELCLLSQFNDITEIRKYIDELRVSRERFSKVFQSSPYAITLTEFDTGKLIDMNESFERITGYTKEEMIGKSTTELNMWINNGDREKTMKPLIEKDFVHNPEIRFRIKSGEIRTWDLSMEVINIDGNKMIIGMIDDITNSKRDRDIISTKLYLSNFALSHSLDDLLEETLNEAEKLTDSLIGFYHFVNDDQLHLTLQNWSTRTKDVFCKAEGKGSHYTIDEAGVWVDCVKTREPVIHNDYLSLSHRKGLPPNHAEVIRELVVPVMRNGKIKAILGVGNKSFDYNNKDVETVSLLAKLVWDITERKKMDDELKENEAKLRDLLATKDKFFNIIAHDLRSPFNAIMGFSDLLEEQMKDRNYEEIEEYSKYIHSASKRAMNLLSNLLEWSRSQTGKIKFTPEFFDLAVLINEVVELFYDAASQKSIKISKVMPHNIPFIADKSMLENVIRNLISNAIKFTNTNGMIIIKVDMNEHNVFVSVKDNGVGISEEDIDNLFIHEINNTTLGTNKEKGTGLGLLLCKDFVEKHNGKLTIESEPGKGATFSFNIPKKIEYDKQNDEITLVKSE